MLVPHWRRVPARSLSLWRAAGTGAGGLDAGAVAANATYFAYALRKTLTSLSTRCSRPRRRSGGVTNTLLTGYTIDAAMGSSAAEIDTFFQAASDL